MKRIACTVFAAVAVALISCGEATAQERGWLPSDVADALVAQLAERMASMGELFDGGEPDQERLRGGATSVIDSLVEVVEQWGVDGTRSRAPDVAPLGLADSGDPTLDAIGAYYVCNIVLFLQLEDPAMRADPNRRMTSVFGLSALAVAITHLRQPFIDGGKSNADIEAYLTGPGSTFEPLLERIQTATEVRTQAETACQPVILQLLERPIAELSALGAP